MRLLMITQKLDPNDPLLAFTMQWMNALSKRVDHLHVLCLENHALQLPRNVTAHSLGKDEGASRATLGRRFVAILLKVIRQIDSIFVHMVPEYAVWASPVARMFRKPINLWYTHRQDSRELRRAVDASKFVLTAVPESFPFETPKLRAIGHGLDTNFWQPDTNMPLADPPIILQVARLTPIKHQATLIEATSRLQELGYEFETVLVGSVPPGLDANYGSQLRALAARLGVSSRVLFSGGLPPHEVRELMRQATAAVNLSPAGLFDKAALESMMVGVPTIVSNEAFNNVLRDAAPYFQISDPRDVTGLTERLRALLEMSLLDRTRLILDINSRATTAHSLDGLMDRVVHLSHEGAS